VARRIQRRPGVCYTSIWLNLQGLERALVTPLGIEGELQISASETFSVRNTNRDTAQTLVEQRRMLAFCVERWVSVEPAIVMTAFGCNLEGEVIFMGTITLAAIVIFWLPK